MSAGNYSVTIVESGCFVAAFIPHGNYVQFAWTSKKMKNIILVLNWCYNQSRSSTERSIGTRIKTKIKEICPFYCSIKEHDYRQNFWYPWKPCSLPLSQICNYSQSFRNALVGSPGDVLCQSSRLSTCSKMTWVGYLGVIGSKRSSRDWGTRSCSRPCHCWWGRQRHRSCAEQLASWVELDIFSRLTFFLENCAKGLVINKSKYHS